jgi:hypothetical protein
MVYGKLPVGCWIIIIAEILTNTYLSKLARCYLIVFRELLKKAIRDVTNM